MAMELGRMFVWNGVGMALDRFETTWSWIRRLGSHEQKHDNRNVDSNDNVDICAH